jgi:hypothetical protein
LLGLQFTPHHCSDDLLRVELLCPLIADEAAVSQHGDAVGNSLELIETVRDVDDAHALRLQSPDLAKQLISLGCAQHCRWLIENQQAQRTAQATRDFQQLLLTDAQAIHGLRRIQVR